MASLAELELSKSPTKTQATTPVGKIAAKDTKQADTPSPTKTPQHKMSYAEQKEHEKLIKRARKAVSDAEELISSIESKIAEIEQTMATGEYNAELFDKHAKLQKDLDNAMSQWELASMDLDTIIG